MAGRKASDVAPEARTLPIGIAEMESSQHARVVDVVDDVPKPVVSANGRGDSAIEVERDPISAEETGECLCDCAAVTRMR